MKRKNDGNEKLDIKKSVDEGKIRAKKREH